jgi:hypothetical protein
VTLALTSRRAALAPGPWVRNELWRRARAVPSLDLRFAENKSLVDATTGSNLVTFTRASSGTFVGSDGVIRTATTNLLLRSEEFDDAAWTKTRSSITANAIVAPNGTLTGDKLVEDATNGEHSVTRTAAVTLNNRFTISCFVKAAERTNVRIGFSTGGGSIEAGKAFFDLTSQAVATTGTVFATAIQNVGDGWFRISAVTSQSTGTGSPTFGIALVQPPTTDSYTGDGTSGIFLWGAQLEQSSTVGEYIPTTSTINSAPRFDHNPTTGESLGLLVEEQRTNSIRNNTMVGAVAGTPGTLPTNWTFLTSISGITTSVIGSGTDKGIAYIDVKFEGAASATAATVLQFDGVTQIAASSGQAWAASSYIALIAGSFANVDAIGITLRENDSGGNFVRQNIQSVSSATSSFSRFTSATTLGATVAFVVTGVRLSLISGAAIDFTLRIGLPQLEQGAFATSVIPTTTATVTRSADVASITGSAFSSWYRQDEGTVFVNATVPQPSAGNRRIVFATDGTSNNRVGVLFNASNNPQMLVSSGGTIVASDSIATVTASGRVAIAAGYKANDFGVAANGSSPTLDTAGSVPSAVDRLSIGSQDANDRINGTIRRLTYWPTRLPNSTLQAITQ